MFLLKNKQLRRITGLALMAGGGLLLWLAPEVGFGLVLLAAGVLLEIVGITLERRDNS
jgi:hypothetical protein